MSHGGGVKKVPKKCQILYEWPLTCLTTLTAEMYFYSSNFLSQKSTNKENVAFMEMESNKARSGVNPIKLTIL